MREHHLFEAYFRDAEPIEAATLVALKLETLEVGHTSCGFVDATLLREDRIICIPFIRLTPEGPVFHRRHRALQPDVRQWLQERISAWTARKQGGAELDLFAPHQNELLPIARDEAGTRACWGLSQYHVIFDEVERYANLSAWIVGKNALDLSAGFGVGLSTLSGIARAIAADAQTVHPIYSRLCVPAAVTPSEYQPQVVFRLGVDADHVEQVLEEAQRTFNGAEVILSARGEAGRDALKRVGGYEVKMTRPGADALGPLDEYLGIFAERARSFPIAEVKAGNEPAIVSESPLRILFVLRSSAETVFGGDVVQVRETAAALRRRGHVVEITTSARPDSSGYDVVHLTNLTIPPETLEQARAVERFEGAVVIMPIFTDHADETVWGMGVSTAVFSTALDDERLGELLANVRARSLTVNGMQPPPIRSEMIPGYTEQQRAILERVDFVIGNAHAEMHRLFRYLDYRIPYAIAPSCANPSVYGRYRRNAFVEKYGFEDFVLVAGRYEPRKNQLAVFEVMRKSPYPLVFIGANHERVYALLARAYRMNVVFLPHMPEIELAGAFAAARVVLSPSWDEVVSLTSLNAALSEASIVLTRNSYEHEYLRDDAEYCDPGDVDSIAAALQRAWTTHDDRLQRRQELAERVREEYNWDVSAEFTERAYYRILASNPRRDVRLSRFAS